MLILYYWFHRIIWHDLCWPDGQEDPTDIELLSCSNRFLFVFSYSFPSRIQERVKIHFEKLILGDEDVRWGPFFSFLFVSNCKNMTNYPCVCPIDFILVILTSNGRDDKGRPIDLHTHLTHTLASWKLVSLSLSFYLYIKKMGACDESFLFSIDRFRSVSRVVPPMAQKWQST